MSTVNDLHTTIGEALDLAGTSGVLIQAQGKTPFALIPLDDELIDFLIERNPRFIKECEEIRQRMRAGTPRTQAQINAMFGRDQTQPR